MLVANTTDKIEVILGAATTTNPLDIHASYNQISSTAVTPTKTSTTIASAVTAVSIVPAPSAGVQNQLRYCNIFNSDSVPSTVTIRANYNGTTRTIISCVLRVNEYLQYTHRTGWKVFDMNGSIKSINGFNCFPESKLMEWNMSRSNAQGIVPSSTYCIYLGKSPSDASNIIVNYVISTAATAPVTWAEAAIYKGIPSLGSNATLTRAGWIDISQLVLTGSNSIRAFSIPVTGVDAGDDIWFVIGISAAAAFSIRSFSVQDIIGAGFLQLASTTRPSTASTLSPTINTGNNIPFISYSVI